MEIKLEEEEKLRGDLELKVTRNFEKGVKGLRDDLEGLIIGHRHDHGQLEKIKSTVDGLNVRIESVDRSTSNLMTKEHARTMIDQLWSVQARDKSADSEDLKQAILKATLHQIERDGYVTQSEIVKILEGELKVMGIGFEQQLESRLQKIRQELQAGSSSSRSRSSSEARPLNEPGLERVQDLIEDALERYAQDGIAKRDFALYSGGARVIPQLTSQTYQISAKTWSQKIIGFFTGAETVIQGRGPMTALSQEDGVGMCWPLQGSNGQIGVYLSRRIMVTEVTIEHVSKSLAYDLDSSPRQIEVWSIEDSTKLLDLVYDPLKPSRIQTFRIPDRVNFRLTPSPSVPSSDDPTPQKLDGDDRVPIIDPSSQESGEDRSSPILRQAILFKIKSNYGNPFYTCIYRLRVHGLMESELISKSPVPPPSSR